MWLFKICGLILIFISCWAVGFLKAVGLKKRGEKLTRICIGTEGLANRIFMGQELKKIIPIVYDCDTLYINKNKISFNEGFLLKEDAELLREFIKGIGMRDKKGEYERCLMFIKLFEKKRDEAMENFKKLSKLYNSLGVLCGIFICIFFL